MADIELLKNTVKESGMTIKAVCQKSGMKYHTYRNRLKGIGDFTTEEIKGLSYALQLTTAKRNNIFLPKG